MSIAEGNKNEDVILDALGPENPIGFAILRGSRIIQAVADQLELAEEEAQEAKYVFLKDFNAGKVLRSKQIGFHYQVLPPGFRSSLPHAKSDEDEATYIVEGTPDLWQDGQLYRLKPGDAVGWPSGTGLAHCIINNTTEDVVMLAMGERTKPENRFVSVLNAEERAKYGSAWWEDAPPRTLGPHDGLPDARRKNRERLKATKNSNEDKAQERSIGDRPDNVTSIYRDGSRETYTYPYFVEKLAAGLALSQDLKVTKIGIHHQYVLPGTRTSYPHAHSLDEEILFVLRGNPYLWVDGKSYLLQKGDVVFFAPKTGICHTFYLPPQNSLVGTNAQNDFLSFLHEQTAELIVLGDNKVEDTLCYPFALKLNEILKTRRNKFWYLWRDKYGGKVPVFDGSVFTEEKGWTGLSLRFPFTARTLRPQTGRFVELRAGQTIQVLVPYIPDYTEEIYTEKLVKDLKKLDKEWVTVLWPGEEDCVDQDVGYGKFISSPTMEPMIPTRFPLRKDELVVSPNDDEELTAHRSDSVVQRKKSDGFLRPMQLKADKKVVLINLDAPHRVDVTVLDTVGPDYVFCRYEETGATGLYPRGLIYVLDKVPFPLPK